MSFELISGKSKGYGVDVIMFEETSKHVQRKILHGAGIEKHTDNHWDVLPLVYVDRTFDYSNQEAIDTEVLTQMGYYGSVINSVPTPNCS